MSEAHDEALDELRQLTNEFRERASGISYGFFHGGDPREFSPDPDCSEPEEREAHRQACERWNGGDRRPVPMPQCSRGDQKVVGFGLGVNTYEDPEAADAADRLARILDRLERE